MGPLAWVAIAGLNAAMAAQKSAQQARQRQTEANLRAAEIEASPWTGRAPSTQVSTAQPSFWADLAGAGVNTLGQGAALQQSGLFTEGEAPGAEVASKASEDPYEMMLKKSQNKSLMYPWQGQSIMSTKNPWE